MNEEYPVLFICYSSADKSFVEKLIQDLRGVGVGVWYDKWEIRIGDSITQKIAEGIRSSSYLGIVLSKSAIESEWVNRELNSAIFEELERKKVYILPILKEKCEIPTLLKDKKYANMYENYDNGLNELIKITKRTSIFLDHPSILRKPIEIERKKSRIKENSIEKEIAHLLNKNLRLFCDPKPENEMDFQREIYKLLRSHNYFVSWNTDQTTFSGRGVKPDFSSKDINLAIEAKYLGTKTNINRIIEEMAADVTLYSKDYTNIIFVIYDRDQKISDREIFVKDFENRGNIIVIVI
jgi:hypothetical protein